MKGSQDIVPELPNTKFKAIGNNLKTTCSSYFLLSNLGRNFTICMKVRESLTDHNHLYKGVVKQREIVIKLCSNHL